MDLILSSPVLLAILSDRIEASHDLVESEFDEAVESQYGPTETSRARSAELAYWIAPEHHGEGYGSDAAGRLVEYAFTDRNLRRLSACVGGFNDASIALLESLGFKHEGSRREAAWYQGEYYDMLCYGLLRSEWLKTE